MNAGFRGLRLPGRGLSIVLFVLSRNDSIGCQTAVYARCSIVTDSADEDPISSLVMFLRDWDARGLAEIMALSNSYGERLLYYKAYT